MFGELMFVFEARDGGEGTVERNVTTPEGRHEAKRKREDMNVHAGVVASTVLLSL